MYNDQQLIECCTIHGNKYRHYHDCQFNYHPLRINRRFTKQSDYRRNKRNLHCHTIRTDAEIIIGYTCQLTGNESGLVAYYNFNAGAAAGTNTGLTTLIDATASGNNGTLFDFALTGATSNWVAEDIITEVTPSVSIAASPSGTITAGTSVTFTATAGAHKGAAPTYQWKKNGSDISGANSATYSTSTLSNGNIISCTLTNTGTCLSTTAVTSTGITMSVNAVLPVELLDFKATPSVSGNLLTWTTANEVNNKGFNVERLMESGQWIMLGFVKSTSARLQTSPTLIDVSALPQGAYFLKVGAEQVKFVKQ